MGYFYYRDFFPKSQPKRVAGGIKAAFVETVIPSRSYFVAFDVLTAGFVGPGTGVLGVSSITFSNFGSSTRQVSIRQKVVVGPTSDSQSVPQSAPIEVVVFVQALSTLHLAYPSPLVFNPINGFTCLSSSQDGPGSVFVQVNGFIN